MGHCGLSSIVERYAVTVEARERNPQITPRLQRELERKRDTSPARLVRSMDRTPSYEVGDGGSNPSRDTGASLKPVAPDWLGIASLLQHGSVAQRQCSGLLTLVNVGSNPT